MMILLTGGAGYIGLHTAAVLVEAGHEVVLFDNFSNSKPAGLKRLEAITGRAVPCVEGDVRSRQDLDGLFDQYPIGAVVHFAGLKAVGESQAQPLRYYDNNVGGSLALLAAMQRAEVRRIVFSSSATIYGNADSNPIPETAPLRPANVYGRSKLMVEDILRDLHAAAPGWSIALLRYFNPVGAHPGGLIGEDPNDIPNNLMPFVTQVAVGRLAGTAGVRRRLSDARRHRGARLHPCHGPGGRPPGGAGLGAARSARTAHGQSWYRAGLQRTGAGTRLRTG
jgi:UDP-glucose 4-epimerase